MKVNAFILTILVGLFFFIGFFVPKFFKKKDQLILFTTGFIFVLLFFLMGFDLIPEIIDSFQSLEIKNFIFFFLASFGLGFLLLKLFDFFIPEHHHDHKEKDDNRKEHESHLFHIGFITSISLIIHNMLEGISIYITGLNDFKVGFIMALSVGFHNLPLGMEMMMSLETKKKSFKTKAIIILLAFSSSFGAFLLLLIGKELNKIINGLLLSMTLGMLVYIVFLEILPEIKTNFKVKEIKYGLGFGLVFSILLSLF